MRQSGLCSGSIPFQPPTSFLFAVNPNPAPVVQLASTVMGYPIDDFQRRCLKVMMRPEADLLAMAPTGSGSYHF
jgi:hypothetical protein